MKLKETENYTAILVNADTRYIISTSGRISSAKRYQKLLREVLKLNIAYLPVSHYAKDGKIKPEDFANLIRGLGAIGGAISKDIKHTIIPYLDELNPMAKQVQSVNTVIREGEKLIGYNTDVFGFESAIKKGIKTSNIPIKTAVIYGYGGVFNVAYHVLTSLGIKVFVTGRNQEEVDKRNKEFNLNQFNFAADLFVNATPASDFPLKQAQGFLKALYGCKLVFDHQMPGTYLKKYCEEAHIFYIPGTEMYYPQMYKQWAIFLKEYVKYDDLPKLISMAENG